MRVIAQKKAPPSRCFTGMTYGRCFILLPDIHRGRSPFRKAVSAGAVGFLCLCTPGRWPPPFPLPHSAIFQFVISEENIAGPQRPDIPRRRFQAHILDRRAHRLDVRHFHQMLVYGKFAVVVLPLAVDKEDDDRRLFQHAGRINRGGDIFLIPFSENGRFIAPVPFDAFLQSADHFLSRVSADDHKTPGLLIMLRRRPGGCFQKSMQIFLRDVLLMKRRVLRRAFISCITFPTSFSLLHILLTYAFYYKQM